MDIFLHAETWIALFTLTLLEIVLGVDNLIFISLIINKLPEEKQFSARLVGLALALVFRIAMLIGITWIIQFDEPFTELFGQAVSGRDVMLALGGGFLIAKSTSEIHGKVDSKEDERKVEGSSVMINVIFQIALLDIVFSFDSILTAIGMTDLIVLMVIAIVIAMIIMLIFSEAVGNFIHKHPTLQILALSFLILIGFMLILDAVDIHVPKGYIYFAVFFSLVVEMINMRLRKKK